MEGSKFVGINIQWPISTLIISGTKLVETRFYPMPEKYIGKDLVFIETPGPKGNFNSRMVGIIRFGESFEYKTKSEFRKDLNRHRVEKDSTWDWSDEKNKWGWPIEFFRCFLTTIPVTRRGIVFRTGILLPKKIKFKSP